MRTSSNPCIVQANNSSADGERGDHVATHTIRLYTRAAGVADRDVATSNCRKLSMDVGFHYGRCLPSHVGRFGPSRNALLVIVCSNFHTKNQLEQERTQGGNKGIYTPPSYQNLT